MVIAIIILSLLLIVSIIFNVILRSALRIMTAQFLTSSPEEAINYYYEKCSVKEFPCTLLISMVGEAQFEGVSYDFSIYEEKGVVGLIGYKKEKISEKEEMTSIIPNQKVLLMKDGEYMWDMRPFL